MSSSYKPNEILQQDQSKFLGKAPSQKLKTALAKQIIFPAFTPFLLFSKYPGSHLEKFHLSPQET